MSNWSREHWTNPARSSGGNPPADPSGVWRLVEQWSLQGGSGAVALGETFPGLILGVPLEYGSQNSALNTLTKGATGVTFAGAGAGGNIYSFLRAPLASLLGRAWNPADSLAVLAEFDGAALPGGSPHVLGGIYRSPTADSTAEAYLGGWEYTSSNARAFAETLNTAGAGAVVQRTTYVPSAGFDLIGGLINGYTARGFVTPGGAMPADEATTLTTGATFSGGTTTAGLIGAATGVPDYAGAFLYRTVAGTVGVLRNLTFWRWES